MARIRTYQLDENITANDYLLGNDGDNGSVITKRFNLEDLRAFFAGEFLEATQIPPGYLPTNNQMGTAFERSPLQVQHTNAPGPHALIVDGEVETFDVYFLTLSNGTQTLRLEHYNEPFYLPSFVGTLEVPKTFTFKLVGDDTLYNGTIISYQGFVVESTIDDFDADFDDYADTFIVSTDGPTQATTQLQEFTITGDLTRVTVEFEGDFEIGGRVDIQGGISVGAEASIGGNTDIGGNVSIGGTTQFNDTITVGTDATPGPANKVDLLMHGDLHFDDAEGGIIFGSPDPAVTLTTDGTNLTIDASTDGSVTGVLNMSLDTIYPDGDDIEIWNGGEIKVYGPDYDPNDPSSNQASTTIGFEGVEQSDAGGNALPELELPIQVNALTSFTDADGMVIPPRNAGTTATIQTGRDYFTIPSAQAQTAQALPGLSEDLSAHDEAFSTGQFFYGDDRGTFGVFHTDVTADVDPPLAIAADATSVEIDNLANDQELITDFDATPYSQRLFFVESTNDISGLSDGDTVPGRTYEVVNYRPAVRNAAGTAIVTNGLLSFSLLGAGNIVISAPAVSITGIPTVPTSGSDTYLFLTDDGEGNITDLGKATIQQIAGVQSQLRLDINDDATDDVPLNSIDFEDSGNLDIVSTPTTNSIKVDVTGRRPINGVAQTANFTTAAFYSYILGNVPLTSTQQTITLPSEHMSGDAIRFYDLSSIADGGGSVESINWRVIPAAGERIMRLAADTEIILDKPSTTTEFVWSGVAEIGWIIR